MLSISAASLALRHELRANCAAYTPCINESKRADQHVYFAQRTILIVQEVGREHKLLQNREHRKKNIGIRDIQENMR